MVRELYPEEQEYVDDCNADAYDDMRQEEEAYEREQDREYKRISSTLTTLTNLVLRIPDLTKIVVNYLPTCCLFNSGKAFCFYYCRDDC